MSAYTTSFDRRSFLQMSSVAAAAAGIRIVTEPLLAHAAHKAISHPPGAVMINSNENPLGPCQSARQAIAAVTPVGGRYQFDLSDQMIALFCSQQGLKPEQVRAYAGSGEPLHFAVMAFTSPTRSYVTADPGYEAGMYSSQSSGARVVKVPLTSANAHDVRAMAQAAPDAGLIYVCTPNNPTGTLTSHTDIEYLLENKPKDAVVVVDEAYIHFSDAPTAIDLMKAGKDLIVLRTFSKLYGMAGLRLGLAIARPDLLKKLDDMGGGNALPTPAVVAAIASLKEPQLISERRGVNTTVRQETFAWLDRNGYSYIPSVANFFMLDTKQPAQKVIDAMAQQGVVIGRIWPVMPTYSRVTIGTHEEMAKFQDAFSRVMKGAVVGRVGPAPIVRPHLDGRAV
jgi:histidinol-phosphate aminotransferase